LSGNGDDCRSADGGQEPARCGGLFLQKKRTGKNTAKAGKKQKKSGWTNVTKTRNDICLFKQYLTETVKIY